MSKDKLRGRDTTPAPFAGELLEQSASVFWGVWLVDRWYVNANGIWHAPAEAIARAYAEHMHNNGQPEAQARAFGE